MKKIEVDFSKINLNKVRDDINLFLFNSSFAGMEEMKETNKLIERLKHVKFQVCIN